MLEATKKAKPADCGSGCTPEGVGGLPGAQSNRDLGCTSASHPPKHPSNTVSTTHSLRRTASESLPPKFPGTTHIVPLKRVVSVPIMPYEPDGRCDDVDAECYLQIITPTQAPSPPSRKHEQEAFQKFALELPRRFRYNRLVGIELEDSSDTIVCAPRPQKVDPRARERRLSLE